MTDKNKKDPAQPEKDQRGADPEQAEPKTRPLTADDIRELSGKLTIAGEPVPIDEQGAIKMDALSSFQLSKITDAIVDSLISANWSNLDDARQALHDGVQILKKASAFFEELGELKPYLTEELKKAEYHGMTLEYILQELEPADVAELLDDPDSYLNAAIEEARKAKAAIDEKARQLQDGRKRQREAEKKARERGAIMNLQGDKLTFMTNVLDVLATYNIVKMGALDRRYIDEKTGKITKRHLDKHDARHIKPSENPLFLIGFLTTLAKNSVGDVYTDPIGASYIEFYVPGVLKDIAPDKRYLFENEQLEYDTRTDPISRKTAGVIYLEKWLKKYDDYIAETPDGNRWKYVNYMGYKEESNTMIVQMPVTIQLWQDAQNAYFERRERKEKAIEEGKRPKAKDQRPLEVNELIRRKAALKANPVTLEIVVYLTNTLLLAGNKGKEKTTKIKYKTLIEKCERFNESLKKIEKKIKKAEETGEGKGSGNLWQKYNNELKKIKSAIDFIMDPKKCSATEKYDFINLQPSRRDKDGKAKKDEKGNFIFVPPTRTKLDDILIITWRRKKSE